MRNPQPTPDHIITAICNDPQHVRDKVYEVAQFGRVTLDNGEVRWHIRSGDHWSITVRPNSDRRGRAEAHRRYDTDPELGSTYRWPCRLCPRAFEVREVNLHRVLEAVYRAQINGDTPDRPVTIRLLREVASGVAGLP